MSKITESDIEKCTIEELVELGYKYVYGPDISPDGESPEREDYGQVLLMKRLKTAAAKFNPHIPSDALDQALREIRRISSPEVISNNETFHRFLTDGIPVQYRINGQEKNDYVWLIDFTHPENNEFLAVSQFTVVEKQQNKRPDILLFVNGIPLVVIELKNPADENATIKKAFDQLQTYKATIPSLFTYNAFCVISDAHNCKAGTISAGYSRFMAWKSPDGKKEASKFVPQLETLIKGMLDPKTLTDLVRHFIVFEKSRKEDPKSGFIQVETVKKIAAYHQYYAVNSAVKSTMKAAAEDGDRKGGVVWHTQGSGKSLSMVFYTGKLVLCLNNPTVVVITDRNDLDEQLFETFAASKQLLRQDPVQAKDREDLKKLLKVGSGGIVFTTIQKFSPDNGKSEYDQLSDRSNIVVIADEAHRTQYGFDAKLIDEKDRETKEVTGKRIVYGFARYMRDALPNATYIGFTGTPIEKADANTPAVFGNYVDIYDISKSVADEATVRIYYESRLAKVNLDEEGRRLIRELDDEIEEGEELTEKQKEKARWTRLEAIVGNPKRLKNLAEDIVRHFEARQKVFEGKALIVAMSRRIAVALYEEIIKIKPEWHDENLTKGALKVVMTAASSDGPEMQKHHTNKTQRKALAERIKDPADPLKIVIVRDMWLTGFDAPCLHTLYVDKLMKGHNLMQAIARVNRVFKDKPGGLVVDYLGIASDLKKALAFYSDSGGRGNPAELQEKAVETMLEKQEIIRQMFAQTSKSGTDILSEDPEAYFNNTERFNFERFFTADSKGKLTVILQAEEHILGLEDGRNRFVNEVNLLSKAFALSIPHEKALGIADEVAFFQAVKAGLVKFERPESESSFSELETTIKQVVDEALSSEGVVDIFDAAGIRKPDISILSEEFLMEVKGMKHKNLALELLKRILNDEIKARTRTNLVKSRALLEMLEEAIKKYQNNLLTTAEVIQELIEIAREVNAADQRGINLGLTQDELAFYDALETNDSAVSVLGDETLKNIAVEIAEKVRTNASIDWTIKESARAKLMVLVRRTLSKYGYPPDKQQKAVDTVLKQAELLADSLVEI